MDPINSTVPEELQSRSIDFFKGRVEPKDHLEESSAEEPIKT